MRPVTHTIKYQRNRMLAVSEILTFLCDFFLSKIASSHNIYIKNNFNLISTKMF